jgi:serine/threonine protein kinase
MANEVCQSKPYNQLVDVYSLSMVLYEMLALEKPFKSYTKETHRLMVVEKGERPLVDPSWPPGIQALLIRGWSAQASLRPTMKEFRDILVEEIENLAQPASSSQLVEAFWEKQPVRRRWRDSSGMEKPLCRGDSLRSVDTAETLLSAGASMSC